ANPVPVLSALLPNSAMAGERVSTLTAEGSNFVSGSILRWNGTDRVTTFVNSNRLAAILSTGDTASAGTTDVTVFNPAPGGGSSNRLIFTVYPQPSSLIPSNLAEVHVYPNPWTADQHTGLPITFDQLSEGSTVKIFTISGRWIKTLPAPHGTTTWDLSN